MMEDIFDTAQSSTKDAFEDMTETKPRATFSAKKENYWDKQDIQPSTIDVSKFSKKGKSFVLYVHPENDIPEEAANNILALARGLMAKGYTFRHTGNKDNNLQSKIVKLEDSVVKSYLPWKKFNTTVTDPILATPLGYRIAIGVHKAYMKLPPAVRAILARDVNAMLGVDATDPVDFIITWSDGGAEALSKNSDFKKIGNNSFCLMIASRANIPVVNVFNTNFIDKMKDLIK